MSYIETAIAEAVAASEEPKVETTPSEPVEVKEEATETEESTNEESAEESAEQAAEDEKFSKKAVNALARKDKKITKVSVERDMWKQRALEYEQKLAAPAPREEDFEGQPYGDYLKAVARDEARKDSAEQALEAAKTEMTKLESELSESVKAAIDESSAIAEKTFPDFWQVVQKHATHDRGDGKMIIPFSQSAIDALQRANDSAGATYAILKTDGALHHLNSLPPIEAAMMVKEYEIKAQSLPKIKHVSTAPEPITSARGVASGSKSVESMNSKELLALVR